MRKSGVSICTFTKGLIEKRTQVVRRTCMEIGLPDAPVPESRGREPRADREISSSDFLRTK
jgi:hypothetical protein